MRLLALLGLLVAGCDAASSDYPTVVAARSTAAEWAKVNEIAAKRRLTATYAKAMRDEARKELATLQSSFSDPASPQAIELRALRALPPDAPPAQLRAHGEALKRIEDKLAVS